MKIQVTGSRDWDDRPTVEAVLDSYQSLVLKDGGDTPQLIHGDARGLDRMAGLVADQLGWEVFAIAAEWEHYGRAAGPIRNRVMLDLKPDVLLAFSNNLKTSKGTRDCVEEAIKRGIRVELHLSNGRVLDNEEIVELLK